ncbi:nuclear RNA export factor 1-like [Anoplophora glabripennis]|uniref:nuclear RNA export factor 1-like n=1 Tax=Anoplophora glabripennis TaxID=217634 RepID=UPI0008757861|nr:nuclear RNA export factor 1-like [Anoplophora glabripennis]
MKNANTFDSYRVTINENNLPTGIIYKHKNLIDNLNHWHKFMICNTEKHKRNVILGAILDHVHPLDLIPVSYGKDHGTAHFLARNCGPAITKLAKDNLTVPNPEDPSKPFKLTIILKFATTSEFKVDVQKNIVGALTRRYDSSTRTLDLSNFSEERGLTEFCPLSQPKIMYFVLHLSKHLVPLPERFILSHNRIKLLNSLDAISGVKVVYLDFSNNLIANIDNLMPLKTSEVSELVLDQNPICDNYDSTIAYVKDVERYCPKISILDGVLIKEGIFSVIKPNFLCNPDCYDLANQFLEYFFTIYDSRNRMMMEGLYHTNAMFSLTASYIPGQLSSSSAHLRVYNNCARNLLKIADFSRNTEYLFRGAYTIMKIFNQLPPSEHDPSSFKVDVIYSTPNCAVINVCGVFRELPQNLLDAERCLGFSRTFALQMLSAGQEWVIINEQLHVYNALNVQLSTSFKNPKPTRIDIIPVAETVKDQQQLANALKIITNLNTDWSKKCLEECNYDLKKALALFIDLYKVDKIPSEAFLNM